MKKIYLLVYIICLICFANKLYAERYAHWEYFIPEESRFKLIPENNGLYIQFGGNVELNAELAIQTIGKNKYRVFIILDQSSINMFPYVKLGRIQKPKFIELVNSDKLAKEIATEESLNSLKTCYPKIFLFW